MIDAAFLLYGGVVLFALGCVLIIIGRVLKTAGTVLIAAVVLIVVGSALGLYSFADIQREATNLTGNLTVPTPPANLQPGFEWSCTLVNKSNPTGGFACSVVPVGGRK